MVDRYAILLFDRPSWLSFVGKGQVSRYLPRGLIESIEMLINQVDQSVMAWNNVSSSMNISFRFLVICILFSISLLQYNIILSHASVQPFGARS